MLLFTAGLSVATGLIFGTAPAVAVSGIRLNETLKEGGRGGAEGAGHQRLRATVVISEVALATVLLVGAGLLLRSFARVRSTDPGFKPQNVITMSVSLPFSAYSKPEQVHSFYDSLWRRVGEIPGADSAGFSTDLPMEGAWTHIFSVEGFSPVPGAKLNVSRNSVVMGEYFHTMRIPLLRGRWFNDQDRAVSEPVVIVSESIAKQFWPNGDPIDKRLKWGPPEGTSPWLKIVGVVGDVKAQALDQQMQPHTYEPYSQSQGDLAMFAPSNIAIRSSASTESLTSQVRAIVAGLDPQLAVDKVQTMTSVVDSSIAPRRFNTFLLVLFAACALLLSAVGIYGVIAYSVNQRKHEIGVRMALGAGRRDIVELVLRQGGLMAATGVISGLAGAVGLTRFLSTLLYEIKPIDPITMAAVGVTLGAVALLASYIPAFRATRVDPAIALRFE